METTTAGQMARRLMNEHGLGDWLFRFNRRAVGRLGLCDHGTRTISLSVKVVLLADETTVRNTMLHEIAHALVGPGHGHDWTWKARARSIGCNGNRCHKVDTRSLAPWLGTCGCGREFRRHRLSQKVRDYGRCPSCKAGLNWQRVA